MFLSWLYIECMLYVSLHVILLILQVFMEEFPDVEHVAASISEILKVDGRYSCLSLLFHPESWQKWTCSGAINLSVYIYNVYYYAQINQYFYLLIS